MPSLLARNEPSEDPLFYDMNLDGVVDAEDRAILSGSLPPDDQPIAADDPAFRARLDLTADGHIDSLDGVLFDMLVPVDLPDAESGASGDADDLVRADLDGDGMVTRADYDRWIELTDGVNLPVDSTGASGGSGAPEEARAPEDVNADGRIDLADGDAITQILVRQVEERLGSIPPEGEILGDIGGDGDVTIADAEAAYATFIEGRYDPRLDLNADTEVDAEDWEALGDLIEAHGGDPRPMGPAPTPPT